MTPNKGRIRLLVDALRSGEYRQTTGALQVNGRFCCLGVACEVAIKNGLAVDVEYPGDDSGSDAVSYSTQGCVEQGDMPTGVHEWFGLINSDPILIVPFDHIYKNFLYPASAGVRYAATTLNDDLKLDFNQIADCFEYTYLREEGEDGQQGQGPAAR